jgi:hypothetical protein
VAKVLKGAQLTEQSARWKRLEEEIAVCPIKEVRVGHSRFRAEMLLSN